MPTDTNFEAALRLADAALYQASTNGRDRMMVRHAEAWSRINS